MKKIIKILTEEQKQIQRRKNCYETRIHILILTSTNAINARYSAVPYGGFRQLFSQKISAQFGLRMQQKRCFQSGFVN